VGYASTLRRKSPVLAASASRAAPGAAPVARYSQETDCSFWIEGFAAGWESQCAGFSVQLKGSTCSPGRQTHDRLPSIGALSEYESVMDNV
jgi:hypothetical protein